MKTKTAVCVRIQPKLKRQLDKIKKRHGWIINTMANVAIVEYLERHHNIYQDLDGKYRERITK